MLDLQTIVIVNSAVKQYSDFEKWIQPYIKVFGMLHIVFDRANQKLTKEILNNKSLIIIGHEGVSLNSEEKELIHSELQSGIGVVSFDSEKKEIIKKKVRLCFQIDLIISHHFIHLMR